MNKEEMEKKRNQLWENKIYLFDDEEEHGPWLRSICELHFKSGWDACSEEYESELRIAKADIMNLTEEIERLKSWEHFKKTLSVMQTFQSLGELEKEAINLMIDGIKYRNTKTGEEQ